MARGRQRPGARARAPAVVNANDLSPYILMRRHESDPTPLLGLHASRASPLSPLIDRTGSDAIGARAARPVPLLTEGADRERAFFTRLHRKAEGRPGDGRAPLANVTDRLVSAVRQRQLWNCPFRPDAPLRRLNPKLGERPVGMATRD